MSEQPADDFEERAKREAYYRWVREGRPWLTKEEQDRRYFEELAKLRSQKDSPWWFRIRWLYILYCAVAFFLLMGLLCLSTAATDKTAASKWSRTLWYSFFILLSFEILLTVKICTSLRKTLRGWWVRLRPTRNLSELPDRRGVPWLVASSPWLARTFLFITWFLTLVLMHGVYQLGRAEEVSTGRSALRELAAPASDISLTSKVPEDAGEDHDTALFYSILAGFFLFSALLMFASVFTKVKLEHERQQKNLPENKRLLWEFCHLGLLELGIAIFIAFFITGTFEFVLHRRTEQTNNRYMKKRDEQERRHLEETQRNLFSTLFGFNVNPRFGDEIFQTLRDSSRFQREDCSIAFECDTISDAEREQFAHGNKNDDPLIAVSVTVDYRIRNTSASPQQWKAEPFFVNSLQLESAADRFLFYKVEDCEEAGNCVKAGLLTVQRGFR